MFNNQFRPPMFPNNFGNMGTVSNFNQYGQNMMQFGGMPAPPPFSFSGQAGGSSSPMSNAGSVTRNEPGSPSNVASPTGSSVRRLQQVQHHVQQVPVYRTVQVRERIIEIPQIHIVKEYVPKIEVIERIKEVPRIEIQVVEKIIEVPQIQYVDKYVDKIEVKEIERFVPKIEIVEVPREVPKIQYEYVDKIVEVPQIQYIDKVVEVPQTREVVKHVPKLEIVEVPIKREVRVPKIEKKIVEEIQEVPVVEIIEIPIEKEIRVNVPVPQIQRVERPVPGPLNIVDVEVEVKVPRHVQVPQYIDVPVPREVYKEVPVPRQVPRYKDVEVPFEVEQIVTVPVERRVPIPRTVYKHVEEIKRVEVPYEVTISEEVEEIVEVIQQVQPVIEPIIQTRYERLPAIREKGKAVYVNGGPSNAGLPPLPPRPQQGQQFSQAGQNAGQQFSQPQQMLSQMGQNGGQQFSQMASQSLMGSQQQMFNQMGQQQHMFNQMSQMGQGAMGQGGFANQSTPVMMPVAPSRAVASSPLMTATNLANAVSVRPEQAHPDSPTSPINQDITDIEDHDDENPFGAEEPFVVLPVGDQRRSTAEIAVHIENLDLDRENLNESNRDASNLQDKTLTGEVATEAVPVPTSTFPNLWAPPSPYAL